MTYKISTPASTAPVSTAELSTHLQLFGDTSYDTELAALILTAQDFVSAHLGQPVSATVIQRLFSDFGDICLVHVGTSAITVHYFDVDNAVQVLGAGNYVVDTSGVAVVVRIKTNPTSISSDFANAGYVQYTTAITNVPAKVKHAILMVAAELFEVRAESTDAKLRKAHITVKNLLLSEKRW